MMARYWHQLSLGLSLSTTGMVSLNRRSTGALMAVYTLVGMLASCHSSLSMGLRAETRRFMLAEMEVQSRHSGTSWISGGFPVTEGIFGSR